MLILSKRKTDKERTLAFVHHFCELIGRQGAIGRRCLGKNESRQNKHNPVNHMHHEDNGFRNLPKTCANNGSATPQYILEMGLRTSRSEDIMKTGTQMTATPNAAKAVFDFHARGLHHQPPDGDHTNFGYG